MLGHRGTAHILYSRWTSEGNLMNDETVNDILLDFEEYRKTELIDEYVEDLERLAAELEVTVDYYIAEFT